MNPAECYEEDFYFTLFVVLPSDEVCSLRQLPSGITVHEVQGRLELSAGLPAHVYSLVYPDGERLEDYQRLMVQDNVKDGYILRVRICENWEALYKAVSKNNIQQVLVNGGVQLKGSGVVNSDCADKVEEQLQDRGETALYIASYNGYFSMCSTLLSIGVNSNGQTPFGRTPLHAAVCRDQLKTLEILLRHGGSMQQTDVYGYSTVDIARLFSSKLCTKKLRVMQLNLRGTAASKNTAHNPNRKLRIRKDFLNPPSLHSIMSSESGSITSRPKTTSATRHHVPGYQSPQSQCSVETKDTGTTSCYTLESMTTVSRQFDVASASSRGSSLRISVADNSRLGTARTISSSSLSHRPCKGVTGVINMKPLPSDHLYWRFVEIGPKESGHRDTSYGHPLEILRNKRTNTTKVLLGANFAQEKIDESDIDPVEQENQSAMATKSHIQDRQQEEEEKKQDAIADRTEEARNAGILKAYRSLNDPTKTPIRPKTVRFLQRPQTTNVVSRGVEQDTRKAMHRKINLAATQSRQETKRRLRKFMNQTYHLPAKDNDSDSGNDSENSETRGDNIDAFQNWLQRKEDEKRHQNRPKMPARPLTGIITIGSTEQGDGSPPSPTHDIYAHRDWLEKSRQQRIQNGERMKTASEFMAAKKRLEEKRQRLLLTAISYEEWMENNEERKSLIRDILQADMDNLKKIERDHVIKRAPNQISYNEWQDLLKTRENRTKHRKHYDKQLKSEEMKLKLDRDKERFTHGEWVRAKQEQNKKENSIPKIDTQKEEDDKRERNEQQYEIWLERKHGEEIAELQNMKNNEKSVSRNMRHRRGAPVVVPC